AERECGPVVLKIGPGGRFRTAQPENREFGHRATVVSCLLRCWQIAEAATPSSRLACRRDGSKVTLVQAQKYRGNGSCPATAGSVFRASTSAEIAYVFSGLKDRRERSLLRGGELAVNVLHFLLDPSDAGDFDLAVLSNQEQSGHIGQAVSIRDRVAVRIVEQRAEGNTILFQKGGGV